MAHGFDDVARAGFALGANHRRAFGNAPQRFAQIARAAHERHFEIVLPDVIFFVGRGEHFALVDEIHFERLEHAASAKCPMRTLAITGMLTVSMISRMIFGEAMRATPPSLRMSEGTRSSAITAQAPASSAMRACSALVTSMMTPPLSISARPTFTRH